MGSSLSKIFNPNNINCDNGGHNQWLHYRISLFVKVYYNKLYNCF